MENAFRDGEIKTTGTGIDRLMPPVSRFGAGGARAKKKQTVIDKLKVFFERFFGIGGPLFAEAPESDKVEDGQPVMAISEKPALHREKKEDE